ncbi:hypothetical protein B0H34DRAFT_801388 [Crassisporium funariophilum]|nr:hypothetical protein B0H34DRAFT_801388 [Crassisporium funariophilum]
MLILILIPLTPLIVTLMWYSHILTLLSNPDPEPLFVVEPDDAEPGTSPENEDAKHCVGTMDASTFSAEKEKNADDVREALELLNSTKAGVKFPRWSEERQPTDSALATAHSHSPPYSAYTGKRQSLFTLIPT